MCEIGLFLLGAIFVGYLRKDPKAQGGHDPTEKTDDHSDTAGRKGKPAAKSRRG